LQTVDCTATDNQSQEKENNAETPKNKVDSRIYGVWVKTSVQF